MQSIVLIDNYDSFTYNLVHLLEKITNSTVTVFRNDKVKIQELDKFSHIVLSPGPGLPRDAGITTAAIKKYYTTKKILGVCLGHQAIGETFGTPLINLPKVFHGVATPLKVLDHTTIFKNFPSCFNVGRYHSWSLAQTNNALLDILAVDEFNNPMAIKHKQYHCYGVQYHPESILSEYGEELIKNWMSV